jgi:hypothetical protein
LDLLRWYHRRAPFLFFNGNTFAAIGRELVLVLFSDLPATRRRELGSAVAHYIAGVLDRSAMLQMATALCEASELQIGQRVRTLRGGTSGTILELLEDGRVLWRTDSGSELLALPESLIVNPGRRGSDGP